MLFGKYKHHLPVAKAAGNDRICGNRTSLRGRKPILSDDDIAHIDNLIQAQPDITIHEIMDTLHLKVSDETVRQAVLKLGYVYKKKSLHASEQERPRHPAETGKLAATYSGERCKTPCVSR